MASQDRIAIVGGGASGMMAAIKAAETLGDGSRVVLFDKNSRLGRKIYLTGRGRCNITNTRPWDEFSEHIHPSAAHMKKAFCAFSNVDVMRFFENIGVPVVEQQGQRVFPASLRAADVAQALERHVLDLGVDVRYDTEVKSLEELSDFAAVIVATGGKSYPATGSTGDGYRFAREVGHTVTKLFPSETALMPHEYDSSLDGVELKNVGLSLIIDRDLVETLQGEFTFTCDGMESGIAYRMSRRAVWALMNGQSVKMVLDLKPALSVEKLAARIARDVTETKGKPKMSQLLRGLMPEKLVDPFMKANPGLTVENLAPRLKEWVFRIDDYKGYDRAVVTAGGVDLKEIVAKKMASRLRQGLYFCGEVLDLDGDTGGYNLQIAFSTGALAGISAARQLLAD